jgi:hypothetical protein
MKATELRINNLVNAVMTNEVYSIDLWALNVIEEGNYQNSHNTKTKVFKPIPLTEEWLLKFGFIGKYKSVHTHWNYKGFGIEQKSDEDDFGGSIPIEQVFYYEYRYDIEHVHQLQNLYFALTGEELTLNN